MKKIQKMMNAWWAQFVKQAQMEAAYRNSILSI